MGVTAVETKHSPAGDSHGRAETEVNGLPEAVDNTRLYAALSRAISLAEGRSQSHALRVAYLSLRLGEGLCVDEQEAEAVYYGSLLHDLGVPFIASRLASYCLSSEQSVLAVAPTISAEELSATVADGSQRSALNELVDHCAHGQSFAKELGFQDAVADTIYWHHESWDGSGFPDGISGRDVPTAARIVGFSDWLDAVIGNQMSKGQARIGDWIMRLVSERSGTKFDPDLAEVYESIADEIDPLLELSAGELIDEICAAKLGWGTGPQNARWRQIVGRFGEVVDIKSPYTVGHSRNVASYSQTIAQEMGLTEESVELVTLAALLHDIGKLAVPSKIIDKRGRLTEREWQIVRKHPKRSFEVLNSLASLGSMARIARQHHEWLNGNGYPKGDSGDTISAEARIVAAADAFEGMTAERPHRRAIKPERALDLMMYEKNRRFDPQVLATLVKVVHKYQLGREPAQTSKEARQRRRAA
jgi:putative nucleotidyltransferase with HDIG domain